MSESVMESEKKTEAAKEKRTSQARKSYNSQSIGSSVDSILFLQMTIGNQAVGRLIRSEKPEPIVSEKKDYVGESVNIQREGDTGSDLATQGSDAGTITTPETIIVAKPPASLRSVIGRMDYYLERHYDFNTRAEQGERPPKYYIAYGHKYVTLFKTVLRPNLSPSGKAWLDCTLNALQTAIEDRRDANPWAFAELEQDNDKFQDFAYGTHSNAYVSCGLCDLSIFDEARIAKTPDFLDILTLGGIGQILETFLQCQPSWFYPVGPAITP